MKVLLVGEFRNGKLQESTYELVAFARKIGAEAIMLLAGKETDLPGFDGTLYLAEADKVGEFNPSVHRQLIVDIVRKENPEMVVFSHSSYGWDLAPRVAFALGAAQVSEVVDVRGDEFLVPACNSKLRRKVRPDTPVVVATLQSGAFSPSEEPQGVPTVERLEGEASGNLDFLGYETPEAEQVDLSKAPIIVTAGRGIGKEENLKNVEELARALGGEFGASRPVVDAGWTEHSRQIGSTGQVVAPKLYIACGVSGSIQHLAGMKKSGFVVAINIDREAPIAEIADVMVVADVNQLLPLLSKKAANP